MSNICHQNVSQKSHDNLIALLHPDTLGMKHFFETIVLLFLSSCVLKIYVCNVGYYFDHKMNAFIYKNVLEMHQ